MLGPYPESADFQAFHVVEFGELRGKARLQRFGEGSSIRYNHDTYWLGARGLFRAFGAPGAVPQQFAETCPCSSWPH